MALIEQKGTISAFGDIREGTGKSGYHWQRQNIVLEYQVGESYTEHLVVTADADGIKEIDTLGLKVGDKVSITAIGTAAGSLTSRCTRSSPERRPQHRSPPRLPPPKHRSRTRSPSSTTRKTTRKTTYHSNPHTYDESKSNGPA